MALFLILSPCSWVWLFSQEQLLIFDQAEEALTRDENSTLHSGIFERLQDLEANPIDLNATTLSDLESSGLFTSYQVMMILQYREKYGMLLSKYELASIPGFRPSRLKEISPYLSVHSQPKKRRPLVVPTRISIYTGRSFPLAIGYKTHGSSLENQAFEGSPWQTSVRIKTGVGNRLSLGLAYEKDSGEKGFHGNRPEYLGVYVSYKGYRIVEQVIIGNFRLNNGLGLVQGMGGFITARGVNSSLRLLSSLKPYAGLSQTGTHQGLAVRINLSPVRVTFWTSYKSMDLSTSSTSMVHKETDWVTNMQETGLHRTEAERTGRGLGYLGNMGIHAMLAQKNFISGVQISTEINGLTAAGKDILGLAGDPNTFYTASIYWKWHIGKLETYGEIATCGKNASALLTGIRYNMNSFLKGGIQLHQYGIQYRETFSLAYASGSHVSNERGFALYLQAEPARNLIAEISAEIFHYPAPRYLTKVPSSGFRLNLVCQNTSTGTFQWRVRLMKKVTQSTPGTDEPGIRKLVQQDQSRIDGRLILNLSKEIQNQLRVVITGTAGSQRKMGFAAVQQVAVKYGERVKFKLQFVVFKTPDWSQRIYLYEPGLYHHFNFPVYHGAGQKFTALMVLKTGQRITIEGKISRITYYDRHLLGSGDNLIIGNNRTGCGLQLRLTL